MIFAAGTWLEERCGMRTDPVDGSGTDFRTDLIAFRTG